VYIHLVFACIWLITALAFFVWKWSYPSPSAGWLALLLAAYNLLRALTHARRPTGAPRDRLSRTETEREYHAIFDFQTEPPSRQSRP
jgi:hypothetical protein